VQPQVLQGTVCVTPPPPTAAVITPESISASPVNFEALLRTVFNDGPNNVTISWVPPAGVVVTDVALTFNWACQAGPFQRTIHATPAPGSNSALVDFTGAGNNGAVVPCPENGIPLRDVPPVSAGIRLTYQVNGTGPLLYVIKPYGQATCRVHIPDPSKFPMDVVITEVWGETRLNRNYSIANPMALARYLGADSRKMFSSCNGQFTSVTSTKIDTDPGGDTHIFTKTVQSLNGLVTFTNRVTRTGGTFDEDASFVTQYRIATGEYSFNVSGGQRNVSTGFSSTTVGSKTGVVPVAIGGALQ
jgi:hypothetical protein